MIIKCELKKIIYNSSIQFIELNKHLLFKVNKIFNFVTSKITQFFSKAKVDNLTVHYNKKRDTVEFLEKIREITKKMKIDASTQTDITINRFYQTIPVTLTVAN